MAGRQELSVRLAERIARALDISPAWLLFGEEAAQPMIEEEQAEYQRGGLRLPFVGRASAAGEPKVIWEPIEPPEWMRLPAGAHCIEVRGDSMRPLVWDGQKVVAVPYDDEPKDCDLVVAELADGRQVFKRWWVVDGRVSLESLRTDAPEKPLVVRRREVRRVSKIVGVLF